ncbi:MAG: hypothetical protein KGJ79_18660 [Alphaproteobacteria bacterium]|nr:hypothetical protein [Alphaproteobacteria bacterium]MDE2113158.1 hypothetical protein [Alphaproteobacteria bacterium]MDE2492306.1 hypothetical protein [Alphaproteobacteria bacterium]
MRRAILMALACSLLCTAALAGDGSYEFTWVRQYNGRVYIVRQRMDERRYNQLRAQLMGVSQFAASPADRRGYNNTASVDQSGRGHYGAIGQYGHNDNAAVRQSGSANVTYVNQAGSDLNASPSQSGDHNVTLVDQWNGAPAQPAWGSRPPRRNSRNAPLRSLD